MATHDHVRRVVELAGKSELSMAGGSRWRAALRLRSVGLPVVLAAESLQVSKAASPDYTAERAQMVRTIESYASEATLSLGRARIAPEVLRIMGAVPRHEFVPDGVRQDAYADRPLPIGYAQTISQPLIVALMTDLLEVRPNDVLLEIGTGSGYQAAVLAGLVRQVYTVEIIPGLAAGAADRLQRLGYTNIAVRQGDGYYGWEDSAPFCAIILNAGADHTPPPPPPQLTPGCRMTVPAG